MQKFSVLLSVYSKEKPDYLKLALDSIFCQTLSPTEVVVVKDGPLTMELDAVIDSYGNKVKVVKLPENKGVSYALNEGLKNCSFDIVARMDSDDICDSSRFETQISFLKLHPQVDVVGSNAIRIDEYGNDLHSIVRVPVNTQTINRLIWTCPMNHPTVMYRKSKILSVGAYNMDAGPRQDDYDLWFRCVEYGLMLANIPEPLLYYRFFSDSVKKNNVTVGWCRLKVGMKGCRKLHLPFKAYIGVCIPFVRSLLPYPLNLYSQNLMNRFNPRNKG